jgi:RNA polymerase sigma-70 factor (ECF subfamily)
MACADTSLRDGEPRHASSGTRRLDPAAIGDHLDRLYRAAWAYCGSREAAEDLVQETYVRVLSRPRFLRNGDDLGYLLRALRNTFISQHRRTRSRPVLATADELDRFEDLSSPQPHDVMEARIVYDVIAGLPPHFRDALVAVDVAGLRYRDAAKALRIPEGTLTTRVFRARKRVAATLELETPQAGSVSAGRASLLRTKQPSERT